VGYPEDILDYEGFIVDISPGIRFIFGAKIINENPKLRVKLSTLSKESYEEVSQAICHPLEWKTPLEVAQIIASYKKSLPKVTIFEQNISKGILEEGSIPVRFYFLKHVNYMLDKIKYPEYFCWPAQHHIHLYGDSLDDFRKAKPVYDKHRPPFIKAHKNWAIKTNLGDAISPEAQVKIVSTYFRYQTAYDIIRQLISRKGPFSFDFNWIDPEITPSEYHDWIKNKLTEVLSLDLDSIKAFQE
jgi:hypothetical protein